MRNKTSYKIPISPTVRDWLELKPIKNFGAPESGLIWKNTRGYQATAGSWAGHLMQRPSGRKDWSVRFEGKNYLASRVIYFLGHDVDPGALEVDHIDRNPLNNNITNLRLLDPVKQMANQKLSVANKSGVRGVSWFKPRNKWLVQLRYNNTRFYLGYYECKLEAARAYNDAVRLHCNEFYRTKCNDLSKVVCTCSRCYYGENPGASFRGVL